MALVEKKNRFGIPPTVDDPKISNLTKKPSGKTITVSFTIPTELKREYKLYAARKDLKMVDILIKSFEDYKKRNP